MPSILSLSSHPSGQLQAQVKSLLSAKVAFKSLKTHLAIHYHHTPHSRGVTPAKLAGDLTMHCPIVWPPTLIFNSTASKATRLAYFPPVQLQYDFCIDVLIVLAALRRYWVPLFTPPQLIQTFLSVLPPSL